MRIDIKHTLRCQIHGKVSMYLPGQKTLPNKVEAMAGTEEVPLNDSSNFGNLRWVDKKLISVGILSNMKYFENIIENTNHMDVTSNFSILDKKFISVAILPNMNSFENRFESLSYNCL